VVSSARAWARPLTPSRQASTPVPRLAPRFPAHAARYSCRGTMKPRTVSTCCSVMLLLALAACGGGGDSAPLQPTPAPSAAGDREPAPPAGPVVAAPAPAPSIPAANPPPPPIKPPENQTPPAPPTGGDPPTPTGPAPVSGSRTYGAWSSLVDWPLLAIHAALLPDGRVLTYGTNISRSGGN